MPYSLSNLHSVDINCLRDNTCTGTEVCCAGSWALGCVIQESWTAVKNYFIKK